MNKDVDVIVTDTSMGITGTLNITDGSLTSGDKDINVGGAVTIGNGATLSSTNGTLDFDDTVTISNGGTLTVSGGSVKFGGNLIDNGTGTANLSAAAVTVDGTSTFDVNENFTVSSLIVNGAALTYNTIVGGKTFAVTGTTNVSSSINVNDNDNMTFGGTVTISNGGHITNSGTATMTFNKDVTIRIGGYLTNESTGTLTFNEDVTVNGTLGLSNAAGTLNINADADITVNSNGKFNVTGPSATVAFTAAEPSGSTITVDGTWTVIGSNGSEVVLKGNPKGETGKRWAVQGSGTVALTHVTISDSRWQAFLGTTNFTAITDDGNNTGLTRTITIDNGNNAPASALIAENAVAQVIHQVAISAPDEEGALISSVILNAAGTAIDTEISTVYMYYDEDGDGVLDANETTQIGDGNDSYNSDNGRVTIAGASEAIEIPAGETWNFLIVYDMEAFGNSNPGDTFKVKINSAADIEATGAGSTLDLNVSLDNTIISNEMYVDGTTSYSVSVDTQQYVGEPFDVTVTANNALGSIDSSTSVITFGANLPDVNLPPGNQILTDGTGTFHVIADKPTSAVLLKINVYNVSEPSLNGTSAGITVSDAVIGVPMNATAWDDANDQGGIVVVRWDKSQNDPFAGIGRAVPAATPVTGQPGRTDGYSVQVNTNSGNHYTGDSIVIYTINANAGAVGMTTYNWTSGGADGSGSGVTTHAAFASIGTLGVEIAFSSGALDGSEQWTIRCTPAYRSGDNAVTEYRVLRCDDNDDNGTPDEYHFVASQKPDAYAVPSIDVDTYAQDGPGDGELGIYYIVAYAGANNISTLAESAKPEVWYTLDAPNAKVGDTFIIDTVDINSITTLSTSTASGLSNPAEAISMDNVPPNAVTNVTARRDTNNLILCWDAVTEGGGLPEIRGVTYNIYRAANEVPENADLIVSDISDLTYMDSSGNIFGDVDKNYYYMVKAVDGGRNQSESASNLAGEYDLNLGSGWRLITLPFQLQNLNVADVLAEAADTYSVIWRFNVENGEWENYNPEKPPFLQDFTSFEMNSGYQIKMTDSKVLTVVGNLPDGPQTIELKEGWNLIGIPRLLQNRSVTDVLSPISGKYSVIWTLDENAEWKNYNPEKPSFLQDFTELEPGKGYLIKMSEDKTLTIN